jgi:hypothetical protein
MRAPALRRVVCCLLVALALWPALHHALVARYQLDPWEFFGWSMYAAPLPRLQVGVFERVGGEERVLYARGEAKRRVTEYARLRVTVGEFAPDREFATWVLAQDASREAVILVLRRWRLDRETARLAHDDRRLVFERDRKPD